MLAVGGVEVSARDRKGFCSAVVIAPGVAVTAKHCAVAWADDIPLSEPREVVLVLGESADSVVARTLIQRVVPHDTLDVAAMFFEIQESAGVNPLPLIAGVLDAAWVGSPAELAGFGSTARVDGRAQVRLFATEPIIGIDETHVVVEHATITGACTGDSGGPLLARGNDGHVAVIGILDEGDPSCAGTDYFTRADLIASWEALGEVVATPGASVGCEGLDAVGVCLRGRAIWCESDTLLASTCESARGDVCGWSPADEGFRCVPVESDPCSGTGSLRRCMGGDVVSCQNGVMERRSCAQCGGTCTDWADTMGAGCETL